jgi:hypothetical protein
MKRDFSSPILDLKGKPVPNQPTVDAYARAVASLASKLSPELMEQFEADVARESSVLTLGDVCVAVLQHAYEDERTLDLSTRTKRMKLAMKLVDGGEQEITPEERDLIKPLLVKGVYGGPLVPVRASDLLETEPPAMLSAVKEA